MTVYSCVVPSKKTTRRGGPLGPHQDRTPGPPTGLAKRLVARRLARGLSQEQAAAEVGVSRATLAQWEIGREPRGLYLAALERWLRRGRK